jgi:phosphate transport system permease protein
MMTAPAYRAHPIRNFFRNEGNRWRRHPASALLRLLCRLSVLITIFALLAIVIDLLVKGIPHLTPELFSLKYTTENQSMLPAIINTLLIALVALLVAIPIGVGGAIYLAEYAKRNSPLVRTIRLTAETLQGIPSIIYGLFGMVFFTALRINLTLLSGALTLSLMVLPLILRTTEEALLSIPDSYREGSFGLGAGKMRTVFRVILPTAVPGIMSGVILAIGRIVGESAALIFTSGSGHSIPGALAGSGSSAATLTVHMYILSNEGLHVNEAFASAVVLLALTFIINLISDLIERHIAKKKG